MPCQLFEHFLLKNRQLFFHSVFSRGKFIGKHSKEKRNAENFLYAVVLLAIGFDFICFL